MTSPYTPSGNPPASTRGLSAQIRAEFQAIADAITSIFVSPAFTGTPTAPTAAVGTNTTQIATMAALQQQALAATFPLQAGNAGKFATTDGANVSWAYPLVSRSARTTNTILALADIGKFVDITSGTFAQTISASSTLGAGWYCYYRNSGTGNVTLTPNGAETIDGATTLVLYPGHAVFLQSDGSVLHTLVLSGIRQMLVRDEEVTNTVSGTFTAGSYVTRVLNTVSINTISGASLASNQVTLPAGVYRVNALAPASGTNGHKARLYNVTASASLIEGTSEFSASAQVTVTRSVVRGTFTLSTQSVVALQHSCQTTAANTGLGIYASVGPNEVYAEMLLERIG